MKKLEIIELEKVIELGKENTIIYNIIDILLNAINDWPNPIFNLDDYEVEVNNFIDGEPTKSKINLALSQINFSKNSWEAESLYQLVDVFQFYNEDISLKEIIIDLKMKLGKDIDV